jgi:peptidoglycan/xylan/chitin deacetylase (PgdA/CDA1 family)
MIGSWRLKKLSKEFNQLAIILMYHRIGQSKRDHWQLGVSPHHFDEQMQIIKKYGHPILMREMSNPLTRLSMGKPRIMITFDDGYNDNFHNAKPILERYEIPATFFIVSGAVDSKEEFWWDELEKTILWTESIPEIFDLNIEGTHYHWSLGNNTSDENVGDIPLNGTVVSKKQLVNIIWRILNHLSLKKKKEALSRIAQWSKTTFKTRPDYLPMSSAEIISLANSKLFEVGAHTVTHPMLTNLPVQEQREEIKNSKNNLEKVISRKIESFSYPHGKYSDETLEIMKELKFSTSVTVDQCAVQRNSNPYLLPRFMPLDWTGETFEGHLQKWLTPTIG